MTQYTVIINVDEKQLKESMIKNGYEHAEQADIEELIQAEFGWLQSSGISLSELNLKE